MMLWFVFTGCAEEDVSQWGYLEEGQYILEDSHVNVIRSFEFLSVDDDGLAYGFDLDEEQTEEGEELSCGHGDLTDPNGEDGIDNQLAKIWSLIQPFVGEASEGLLQGAINEGRLLMMVELVGLEDFKDQNNLQLNLFYSDSKPEIGTYGYISPNQTFEIDETAQFSTLNNISLTGGMVEGGPISFEIPIDILEAHFTMNVADGKIRFELDEDGSLSGYIGGAFSVSEVLYELSQTDATDEYALVKPFFENNADMGFLDGECDLFSFAFGIEGVPAYVIRHEAEE